MALLCCGAVKHVLTHPPMPFFPAPSLYNAPYYSPVPTKSRSPFLVEHCRAPAPSPVTNSDSLLLSRCGFHNHKLNDFRRTRMATPHFATGIARNNSPMGLYCTHSCPFPPWPPFPLQIRNTKWRSKSKKSTFLTKKCHFTHQWISKKSWPISLKTWKSR